MKVAAHDVRTPLSSIGTWLELLRDAADAAERGRVGGIIREQLSVIDRTTHDMTVCGAIIDGRLVLDRFHVELGTVLRSAIDRMRPIAARRSLAIDYADGAPEAWVYADPERLAQALENFVSHAIRGMRSSDPWGARIEQRGAEAAVLIDWPEEHVDLVQPLAHCLQLDQNRTPLALAVAWEVIALHGGRVAVEREGRGAKVALTMPLRERS